MNIQVMQEFLAANNYVEQQILRLTKARGPITGAEIHENIGGDALIIWRICKLSEHLALKTIGTKYLRLDRAVKGFARLSPSILRMFLTYSVISVSEDIHSLEEEAQKLQAHIEGVSRTKLELIYQVISGMVSRLEINWPQDSQVCFIIAGDIVYNMSHDIPRPERSTGKLVNGSDMDLVVVVDDQFPEKHMKQLDDAIYREKYRLLITPHIREEIDYVVKRLGLIKEQIQFETFNHMVACKILQEGTLLFGNDNLFTRIKTMLSEAGVTQKLNDLEQRAGVFRINSEDYLLCEDQEKIKQENLLLFYPTEESDEFE